jgi:hypothetical protein
MNTDLFITRFSAWAPGIGNIDEWNEWMLGKREIQSCPESPALTFTDSMFRRRLSQISKMTIQVVHDLLPIDHDTNMIFISFRGELLKQYSINKMMIEEKVLMPAAFSLSVFNAPIALASMALGLKGGYSALYPGENSFSMGLAAAKAALISGTKEKIVFVYADENIPPEYTSIYPDSPAPLAFGILLGRKPDSGSVSLSSLYREEDKPEDFLKRLLSNREIYVPS